LIVYFLGNICAKKIIAIELYM